MRVVIAGGSGTGKTTLSRRYRDVCHADDYIGRGMLTRLVAALDDPHFACLEGCAMPMALRRWLDAHPTGKPCDRLIVLTQPHRAQSPQQRRQAAQVLGVLVRLVPSLERRGVQVVYRGEL